MRNPINGQFVSKSKNFISVGIHESIDWVKKTSFVIAVVGIVVTSYGVYKEGFKVFIPLSKQAYKAEASVQQTTVNMDLYTAEAFNSRLQAFIKKEKEIQKMNPKNAEQFDSQVELQVNNNINNFTKTF